MCLKTLGEKMGNADFPVTNYFEIELTNGEIFGEFLDYLKENSSNFDMEKFVNEIDENFIAEFMIAYKNNLYEFGWRSAMEFTVDNYHEELNDDYEIGLYE